MPFWSFIQVQVEQSHRTGVPCCFGCTHAGQRNKGFKVETLDYLPGDEAGIKSVTLSIKGHNAYGYLKAEKGVHRLVRISPFDSSGRRHTSFVSCDVMPEFTDEIEIEIRPEDFKVDTYRASGAGGQHINKTDSASPDHPYSNRYCRYLPN